jgi:5-(carboxyamino)imidazole ribonucleotide mutase
MVAANTILPIIGVPIKSSNSIDGWDSILSILQMPTGVPVATVALNGSKNAAILAIQILAIQSTDLSQQLIDYKKELETQVMDMVKRLNK